MFGWTAESRGLHGTFSTARGRIGQLLLAPPRAVLQTSMSASKPSKNLDVVASVLSYSLCSGTLVLLNKLTLHHLPFPSLVVCVQLLFTLIFIGVGKVSGLLQVDPLRMKFVIPYLFYIVLFSLGVYCNMKSLSISNVETIIVFRALSPCVVAFLDAIFLGREYPNKRSWFALALIVVGAYCYASFDLKFQTQGMMAYGWPTAYLFIISLEMAYGKRIIRSVDLQTLSGPVLYTNLLGLPPMFMFAVMGHETSKLATTDSFPTAGLLILLLGCVAGTGIGYSGWWCRDKVSATSFTLIGVINKCLTILLNLVVWDQHAPMGGIFSLLLCLVGGTLYQQAPMREESATSEGKKLDVSGVEVSNLEHESLLETEYESSSEKEADV